MTMTCFRNKYFFYKQSFGHTSLNGDVQSSCTFEDKHVDVS